MKNILVVDDDPEILYLMDLILTHNNFNVKITSSWSTIELAIKNFQPHLIILDVALNGADGGELCKKIKKTTKGKNLPVLLFSIHDMTNDYVLDCNAQGFINKPFKTNYLIGEINARVN